MLEAMIEKELARDTLADQPALHVAHRGDHGVDLARTNRCRQVVERQLATWHVRSLHAARATSPFPG
jgi:hypothetical protein